LPVFSDTSLLVLFSKIERVDLLRDLFVEAFIPPAVRAEVLTEGVSHPDAVEIVRAPWIKEQTIASEEAVTALSEELDLGEAEAIALALESGRRIPVLIDDRNGRRRARQLGVPVVGCAGCLVLAKKRGLLASVRPLLDELRLAGLYSGTAVYREILTLPGEPGP